MVSSGMQRGGHISIEYCMSPWLRRLPCQCAWHESWCSRGHGSGGGFCCKNHRWFCQVVEAEMLIRQAGASPRSYPPFRSRTRTLRIMFRDLSRSVCIASNSRVSGLKADFQPLVESSLPLVDLPIPLRCTIVLLVSPLQCLRLRPRGHAIEQHFFERPHMVR
jgi:hypothetical protein